MGWLEQEDCNGVQNERRRIRPGPEYCAVNPHCGDKVRRIFGYFPRMEKLVEAAATAIPEFLETVDTVARRSCPMLPEDSLKHRKEAHPKLTQPEDPGPGASEAETRPFRVQDCTRRPGVLARDKNISDLR